MQEKNPVLSVLVVVAIVAIALVGLFLLFKPGDTTTPDNDVEPTPTVTATATPTVTVTAKPTGTVTTTPSVTSSVPPVEGAVPPENWQPIENSVQGYTAYRPTGFYFRLFPPDMFVLGIDPNQIPSASEYMGVISLMRLSSNNNYETLLSGLMPGYTTTTREIDGRTWTMVEGKTEENELMAAKYVKWGKVKVDSKEFLARLESTASNYGGYADEFEIFITTLQFN